MSHQLSQLIDAKGLNCPIPLMLLKNAMQKLSTGALVTIEVTDVHAELDFEIWCERYGHQLNKLGYKSGVLTFQITKAASKTPKNSI